MCVRPEIHGMVTVECHQYVCERDQRDMKWSQQSVTSMCVRPERERHGVVTVECHQYVFETRETQSGHSRVSPVCV